MSRKRKAICVEWVGPKGELDGCTLHMNEADAAVYEEEVKRRREKRTSTMKFSISVDNVVWTGIAAAKETGRPGIRYFRSDYLALKRTQQDEEGKRNCRK